MCKATNPKIWWVMSVAFLSLVAMCCPVQAHPVDVNNYSFEYFEDGSQIMCHMHQAYEGGNRYFKGIIDDVRIYDRTLSSDEISGLAGTDPNVVVDPNNLVGWWKFDDGSGSTAENSGSFASSHDGSLMPDCPNCPVWTTDAYDGNALNFDGVDDYVEIPALNLDSNTVTMTAWIKRDGNQPIYAGIVYSRDGNTTAGLSFGSTGPGGNPPWAVNNELAYNWDDPCTWDFHSGLIIPVDQWVFVAVVVEPNKATLYLSDGLTVDSNTNVLDHNKEEFDGITRIGSDHVEPFLALMGWMSEGGFVGADVDCNAPGVCEDCRSPAAPDGNAYSYMQSNNTYLYQILEHNIVGGRRYILAFDALALNTSIEIVPSFFYDDPCLGHIELASQTINLSDPNEWMYDQMVDFVAQAGQNYIGEKLGIKFNAPIPGDLNTWKWTFIDNVRMDVSNAAHSPRPADGALGVAGGVVLSWGPGFFAADVNGHEVYLGTDFNDVNTRDMSVYRGKRSATSYDPPGELELGETYYWAIDEVNASDPNSPWPGPVWSFTVHSVYYVDAHATGADDGSSWSDAYKYLQDALADPCLAPGDEIWVAEGTYAPDTNWAEPNGSGDQTATFQLINGVAIYGGFPVGGGSWKQRDPIFYETVLSGDLDGNDVGDLNDPSRNENSWSVVKGSGTDETAVIDGFVITAGCTMYPGGGGGMYNSYGSPSVVSCTFWRNVTRSGKAWGGGMYNYHSSPTVTNCEFTGNATVRRDGGAMANSASSSPKLTNCVFSGNASGGVGGGMYNVESSNPVITNCTFSGNASVSDGGGIYNDWDGEPNLTNCILWGNTGSGGTTESAQIYYSPNSTPVINYTCIEGWTGGLGGTGNIGGDPNFVSEPNDGGDGWGVGGNDDFGDLRLLPGSACIDAGDNDSVPADIADLDGDGNTTEPTSRDLEGHLRFIDEPNTVDSGNGTGPIVDMGAYEYILRIYVDDNAANDPGPGNPGVSDPNEDGTWGHPFDAVQEAIDASAHGDTIVLLQGTYGGSGNRDIDFSGRVITVRSIDPNDPNVVASTIIDPNGRVAEPHRGFVFQSGEDEDSVLNGFTITNGYHTTGGGIYCIYSSPTISNCTFSGNSAEENGGGIFNDNSSPTVTNCEFSYNDVEGGRGGGMCNWDGSNPTITACRFIGNSAFHDGGAIHNFGVSNPTLINCTFIRNSVSDNVVFGGGGLFNRNGSSATLTNCVFVGNMSPKYGGAIYTGISSTLTLTNCTFLANSAINGNALACDSPQQSSPSTVQVSNCIFWDTGDEIWNNDSSTITVTYSNVEGGWSGTGNINSNPVLTPDGHLHSSSPCINLGDPNFVLDPSAPTDMDGEARIMSGRVEIGADEFADSDGDGLPDWWELEHFGGPNTADANADPDGDGINNRDEYELYGSNPNAPPINVPAQLGTIQAAIDAASNGDTVLVAAGTYTGAGNKNLDFGGKSIILMGPSGAGNTIINCQNSGRGFNFHSGETPGSAVIGFKITNGQAGKGGAIVFAQSNPQIRECLITGNTATIQGGGIYSSLSVPTFADCNIVDNNGTNIADIWMEYGGAWIVGTVRIEDSNWIGNDITLSGDGTLWMYPGAALNLRESEILCDLGGPVTVQVEVDSELVIEGDAIIDLNDPADPNNNGVIDCDGVLRIKDNVQVINGNINVTRASFEDNSTVSRNVIIVDSRAPYGQFFIDPNVTITYNDIYADGDRYMDLDPSIFEGVMQNNRIFVTITEGVGRERGGLFELRGDPNFADPNCDPNGLMCQVDPCSLPDCNVATWTIERLELIEGAKVTLTNRFGFQPPYEFGDEDEVLYVKNLILREDSIFNTSYNYVYYENLIMEPNASTRNEPLLGFSLSNIALDDQLEFIVRVIHNNFEDPIDPNNNRIHVERVEGLDPDPNGMMRMRNLVDPSTDDVVNARAKGLFAKADEDEILVRFEYLFGSYGPGVELAVYLSDEPELLDYNDPYRADHYVEVATLRPPPPGRYGAPDSNHLGVFEKTVSSGSLDFIRGVRIELELKGPDGTSILINNWDPFVTCTYCGDVTGDFGVSARDFLTVLGEFGQPSSSTSRQGNSLYCTNSNFSDDGYIDQTDLMGYDWTSYLYTEGLIGSFCFPCYHLPLKPCSKSWKFAGEKVSGPLPKAGGLASFRGPLLIAGKRFDAAGEDFLGDRLYEFDEEPNLIGGPFAMDPNRMNGKLIRDFDGRLYQINLDEGLVRISDGNAIIPRGDSDSDINEPRYGESATVYVGFQASGGSSWGRPILDAAFDLAGYVYVTPVVVRPVVNEPYIASAKLELVTGDPPYNVLEIFDDAPLPADNEDPNNRREIEVDDQGRVYVVNKGYDNNSDILRVYDANGTVIKKCNLQDVGIYGPTGLCCSSYDASRLYVASSLGEPDACSTSVYIISKADLLQSSGDPNVQTITVNGMGHITDITENPETGKVWAVGFTMPKYVEKLPGALADVNEFYEPNLVEIPYGSSGPVQAINLSDANDLALPLSIVYTKRCGWADLDGGDDVDFGDFEVMGSQWLDIPGSPSADIAPETPDGIVDMLDLAVLVEHWLEENCTSP